MAFKVKVMFFIVIFINICRFNNTIYYVTTLQAHTGTLKLF